MVIPIDQTAGKNPPIENTIQLEEEDVILEEAVEEGGEEMAPKRIEIPPIRAPIKIPITPIRRDQVRAPLDIVDIKIRVLATIEIVK